MDDITASNLLQLADEHFRASEREQSSEGRDRATERAGVMATMAVAAAIIELRIVLEQSRPL